MSGIINSAGSKSGVIGTTELDYEEGNWTATIAGSSSAGTATYVHRPATYTKIGRMVLARTFIIWNSGNGSGNLQLHGLPFTNYGDGAYGTVSISNCNGVTLASGNCWLGGYINDSSTYVVCLQGPTGGGSAVVPYDGAGEMMLTATYQTN